MRTEPKVAKVQGVWPDGCQVPPHSARLLALAPEKRMRAKRAALPRSECGHFADGRSWTMIVE